VEFVTSKGSDHVSPEAGIAIKQKQACILMPERMLELYTAPLRWSADVGRRIALCERSHGTLQIGCCSPKLHKSVCHGVGQDESSR
jgi:hypothetical protein